MEQPLENISLEAKCLENQWVDPIIKKLENSPFSPTHITPGEKLEGDASVGMDSSVSLIDLENMCEVDDLQFVNKTPEKKQLSHNDELDLGASPIPFAEEMDARIAKTPTSYVPQVSSPFHTTEGNGQKRQFTIPSTTASPISTGNIVASTPFHNRNHLSSVSEAFEFPVNTTYNIGEKDTAAANATFSKPANATYDAGIQPTTQPRLNSTYNAATTAAPNTTAPLGNATFNIETADTKANPSNATFDKPGPTAKVNTTFSRDRSPGKARNSVEVTFSQFTDTGVPSKELQPSFESSDISRTDSTGSDGMDDAFVPATVASSTSATRRQRKTLRKPLALVNSTGNVRPKSSEISAGEKSKLAKKPPRINPPRMNTAAMSRIQARSPQKNANHDQQDENVIASSMKPPSSTSMLRKPLSRKSVSAPRKSLLPPPASKTKPSTSSSVPRPAGRSTSSSSSKPSTDNNPLTPSKRKADSPKHSAGRTAKFDPNRTSTIRPSSTSSSVRSSGIVTSRIASLSNRSNTKLQRPQGPTSQSVSSSTCVTTSQTTMSSVNVPRSRGTSNKLAKPGTKRSRQSPENTKSLRHRPDHTSQCAVAMATLLDFVVNKLDGLSAPELSATKQCLERLVDEQKETNTGLNFRVVELETSVRDSREAHARDVTEANERYNNDVTRLKEEHESELKMFNETLQDITQRLTKQEEDHVKEVATIKQDFSKKIEELESKHEAEVAQLRLEWSDEREEMERDTEDLRNNLKTRVEQKVEELMQPYRNAHEENKSLRAVLEMKSAELHKTQLEISQQSDQHHEVRTLRDHVISLQQKNEDLTSQVNDKSSEHRSMKQTIQQLRQDLEEQKHQNNNQQQRIEELLYRINSNSPSPASPFNPIFTPSPTQPGGGGDVFDTPIRKKQFGHNNGHSAVATSRENGTH
uniref:Proteoglycan 4-like n=1 Tax=Phallusia mammillata TaxID=59560 RepID=A0A6F9DC91_9ASCI|nr:proteoglycan 4-like [Phallusia mammillata]